MSDQTGILTFDWHADVTEQERERIFSGVLKLVDRWRLHFPVMLALESAGPMSHLAGQTLIVFSPLMATFLPDGIRDVQRLVKLLDDPKNVRDLVERIAQAEEHATRKR
jgi:hypothetical protein